VRYGDLIGLEFDPAMITIFESAKGKALVSAGNEGVLRHG
jgi:multiple sugar transport system ATP-binding protein